MNHYFKRLLVTSWPALLFLLLATGTTEAQTVEFCCSRHPLSGECSVPNTAGCSAGCPAT